MNVIKRSEVILAKKTSLGNGRNPEKGDTETASKHWNAARIVGQRDVIQ